MFETRKPLFDNVQYVIEEKQLYLTVIRSEHMTREEFLHFNAALDLLRSLGMKENAPINNPRLSGYTTWVFCIKRPYRLNDIPEIRAVLPQTRGRKPKQIKKIGV